MKNEAPRDRPLEAELEIEGVFVPSDPERPCEVHVARFAVLDEAEHYLGGEYAEDYFLGTCHRRQRCSRLGDAPSDDSLGRRENHSV